MGNGKLKDSYNKCKQTNRQMKKQIKNSTQHSQIENMTNYLENKWKNQVNYKCVHCLQKAYQSENNEEQGYVTDEDLIISSNFRLKHM